MTLLMLAAAALLTLVASLPAPAEGRVGKGLLALVLGVLCGALAFRYGLHRGDWVANSATSRVLKYALTELGEAKEANVLLIGGGSYAQRGIDTGLLEQELRSAGYPVRVVRLAMAGANHFERYQLYRDVASHLRGTAHPGQLWTFLDEAHAEYDTMPLAQFAKNSGTVRAYHYLTPSNAWYALHAERSVDPAALDWRGELDVARHALVNAFSVGEVERVAKLDGVKRSKDSADQQGARRFDWKGTKRLVKETRRPVSNVVIPEWLGRVRDPRLEEAWRPHVDQYMYYAVPSTVLAQLRYARAFCKAAQRPCIAPDDAALLRDLDSKSLWLDAGHLSASGARVYTRWLAAKLVESGKLKR